MFFIFRGQNGSSRTIFIKQKKDTIKLDSLTLVPGSLIITTSNQFINQTQYTLNEEKNYLIFNDSLKKDTALFKISYKVFPFNIRKEFKNKDVSLINRDQTQSKNPYIISYDKPTSSNTAFLNDAPNEPFFCKTRCSFRISKINFGTFQNDFLFFHRMKINNHIKGSLL